LTLTCYLDVSESERTGGSFRKRCFSLAAPETRALGAARQPPHPRVRLALDSNSVARQSIFMASSRLRALLDNVGAVPGDDGWLNMPDSRTLTLHLAHDGVPLTISKIKTVRERDGMVEARTAQGEVYVLLADDVFAVVAEATKESGRRAGFV